MHFLKSENFKNRFLTSLALIAICGIALLTPNMIAFRIIFGFACIMAMIEIAYSAEEQIKNGIIISENAMYAELAIIAIGSSTTVFCLYPVEIMLVLITAVANDTIAYFIGNMFHDRFFVSRPFPKTSPKKSWEGIIGGYIGASFFIFAFLAACKYFSGYKDLSSIPFSNTEILCVFLAPAFAIFGDYVESFVKRLMKIKDSGDIIAKKGIPCISKVEGIMKGHGGFADRIDSCVAVSCFILWIKLISPPT